MSLPAPLTPLDPESLPVLSTGHGEPQVPAERLQARALRRHFAAPPAWTPELLGDRSELPGSEDPLTEAAVLIPLVQRRQATGGDTLQVLLTRRTAQLRKHAGQISFPGGRAEAGDAGPVGTALREAQEEIGLATPAVELLGCLPVYTTVTRYRVTPVVGLVDGAALRLQADPAEVGEIFEVPLAFLMDPRHHERRAIPQAEGLRTVYSMPWSMPATDGSPRRQLIWGATAAMLRNLYQLLRA